MADRNSFSVEDPLTPENFETYQNSLFSALAQVTKSSQFLVPSELGFYKASAEGFGQRLSNASDQLLGLCNRLLLHAAAGSALQADRVSPFEDADDVTDRFAAVVDTVDNLLEKADVCLDQVTGRIKMNAPGNIPGQSAPVIMQVPTKNTYRHVVHAQNIVRPQLKFEDKVDNSNAHFVRKIAYKPNALRPLDYGLPGSGDISAEMGAHLRTLGITDASSSHFSLPHPYEYEIQNLEYPSHMFESRPEQLYAPMEETPFTWVDTDEKLDQLAALLDTVTEIAIDTEHHDYRSFQGFVCLVQISTRNEDFIIDTLSVRSRMHILNSSFTNPAIVKVFHGADMDIQWLQRDYGLYIVNLFDTYHASHLLEMAHHGLQFLLKYYCNVETNKAYQLADWRIRPLPTEMMKYARSDTHFLLYIYDRMRNELLSLSNPETHNLLQATLTRSAQTSLKKYEKEIYDSETGEGNNGWRTALRRYGGALRPEQFAVFRAIHAWRDHVAREEDESPRYVLPTHMMFTLADRMPTDQQGILGCCSPVPPLVRMYATDLAHIIENGLVEATRSKERNEAMLKKLAEDEKEWKEKKSRGPQHTRFEEKDEMDIDQAGSPGPGAATPIETLPFSHIFGTRKEIDEAPKVARVTVTTRSIFGGGPDNSDDEMEERKAKQIAEEIRRTLYLVAPSSLLLKRKRDASRIEDPPADKAPRQEAESLPAAATTTAVVSDSLNGENVKSDSVAEGSESKPLNQGVEHSRDMITIEDEEIEVANVKRKASKKKNKKKSTANTTLNDTPTGSPAPRAEKATKKFQPFDYANAKSMFGRDPAPAKPEDGEVIVLDSDEETKPAPRKGNNNPQRKVFNPYGASVEPKQKKDPRANLRPKSGNKSGTFKRSS